MKKRIFRILKIVGKVLVFAVVLALLALPAVFINKIYGYWLLLFVVIVLAASVICMFIMRQKILIETGGGFVVRRRGEAADVSLEIVNKSLLFSPKSYANVFISDLFGGYDGTKKTPFMIGPKDSVKFSFDADMSHIGTYSIGIDKVTIYDFTGLFHTTASVNGKYSAYILPRVAHVEDLRLTEDMTVQSTNNTRVIVAGGTDYTGVREYALGDPMKQIHWKLSAHSQEYMTKLQENSRRQLYSVILDFASVKYDGTDTILDINDTIIETGLSLTEEIMRFGNECTLIFADRSHNIVKTKSLGRDREIDLISSFAIIEEDPDPSFPDGAVLIDEESKDTNSRGTNVIVVSSRITPQLVQSLITVNTQRRSPEIYVPVPAAWSTREVEDYTAALKQLNEYDIPYFTIPTKGNI